jgi:hypothetical protein
VERSVNVPAGEVGEASLQDEVARPGCPMRKKPARSVFAEVDRIIHHHERQYRELFLGEEGRTDYAGESDSTGYTGSKGWAED